MFVVAGIEKMAKKSLDRIEEITDRVLIHNNETNKYQIIRVISHTLVQPLENKEQNPQVKSEIFNVFRIVFYLINLIFNSFTTVLNNKSRSKCSER